MIEHGFEVSISTDNHKMEVNTKLCAKSDVCTSGVITWRNYGFL